MDFSEGLTALLTFDSVPGCHLETTAFLGGLSEGRVDGRVDRSVWVSFLFWCLCFLKGGNDETEAPTQASVSALKV